MKSFDQLVYELSERLQQDDVCYGTGTMHLQYDPDVLARWILKEYKPPTEWEARGDGLNRTFHSFRVTIAGQFFKYTATITDEQAMRDGRVVSEIKKRVRWMVGRTISDFLDGEEVVEREPVD